jgi:hypothetical protein
MGCVNTSGDVKHPPVHLAHVCVDDVQRLLVES